MQQRIGPYEVVSRAGYGATSAVFRARDPRGGRDVAVKVLLRSSPDALARFERERRLLGELARDGGIVPILDAGTAREGPYVVMPFLEGGTLRDRLRRGALGVEETVDLGRRIARALARCHERGVVHRDLKPENVLFDGPHPLVADLGLAKHFRQDVIGASKSEDLSRTGELRGTPGYSAPEQLRDAKSAGPQADVFALGAILYECLTGARAFPGSSSFEVYTRMEKGPPDRMERRDAPAWLVRAIDLALARNPKDRPADAGELLRLLEGAPARSGPRVALVAAPLVMALLAAGGWLALRGGGPPPPPPPPPTDAVVADFVERSRLLAARGAYPDAIEQATRALERAPSDARGWLQRGRVELDVLDYRAAARDFERAAELDPKLALAWAGHGWALAARVTSTSRTALAAAAKAVELDPTLPEGWIARSFATRLDDAKASIAAAQKAVSLAPRDPRTHAALGDALGSAGDWTVAIPHVEDALRLAPDDPYALLLRAIARWWLDTEPELARSEIERCIARAPRAHLPRRLRAELRAKRGDDEGSIADLVAATEIEPEDPRSWSELGVRLVAVKRDSEAEAAYTKAILFGPEYSGGFDNRGRLRLAHQDFAGAAGDLRRAAELDTKDPQIFSMLAMAEDRLGHFEKARGYGERAVAMKDDLPDGWLCLGDARRGLGDTKGALEAYDKCVALGPRAPTVYLARASLREQLGDTPGAIADCEKCLEGLGADSKEFAAVKQNLARLRKRSEARQ